VARVISDKFPALAEAIQKCATKLIGDKGEGTVKKEQIGGGEFDMPDIIKQPPDKAGFPNLSSLDPVLLYEGTMESLSPFETFDGAREKIRRSELLKYARLITARLDASHRKFHEKSGHYITLDNVGMSIVPSDIKRKLEPLYLKVSIVVEGTFDIYIGLMQKSDFAFTIKQEKLVDIDINIQNIAEIWIPTGLLRSFTGSWFLSQIAKYTEGRIGTPFTIQPEISVAETIPSESTHTKITIERVKAEISLAGGPIELALTLSWDIKHNKWVRTIIQSRAWSIEEMVGHSGKSYI
jgi:hypothetical protein